MATFYKDIVFSDIKVGPEETGNNGGKYRKISYNGNQLKDVQLGKDVNDLLKCPYGVEPVAQDQPNKFCVKVDVSADLAQFIRSMDDLVISSVNAPGLTHRSTLRSVNAQQDSLKIKILPETQVFVMNKKEKYSRPELGTTADIKAGSMILPIIKIQGGVYFIESNYGTSMVATQILVVNGAQSTMHFNLGDISFE